MKPGATTLPVASIVRPAGVVQVSRALDEPDPPVDDLDRPRPARGARAVHDGPTDDPQVGVLRHEATIPDDPRPARARPTKASSRARAVPGAM